MALKYTTVKEFWEFLGINLSILEFQPGNIPSREDTSASVASTVYLNQLGINPDTLVVYVGDTDTELTLTTDYTFNSNTSALTITASGETALGGTSAKVVYEYNQLAPVLTYNTSYALLSRMEQRLEQDLQTVFADQSSATPSYTQILDEFDMGQGFRNNMYHTQYFPLISLQTTVDGNYTTGGTTLTLTSASGFPSIGTIYVGGNKVSYTAKTGNDLTVPSSTPSISDGATVRGEVIEVSLDPQGVQPSFTVLTPDVDYHIDYDTGNIQLFNEYYQVNLEGITRPINGLKGRLKYTYMQAWHKNGQNATIPTEIEELVYMMAGRNLVQRTIVKANVGQRDNFTSDSYGFSKVDMEEIKDKYRSVRCSNV